MICNVKHPHLRGIKCNQKRGHTGWHRGGRKGEPVQFWDKGRGQKDRQTATMQVVQS